MSFLSEKKKSHSCGELRAADVVVTVDGPGLGDYTSTTYLDAVMAVVTERNPRLVMASSTSVRM